MHTKFSREQLAILNQTTDMVLGNTALLGHYEAFVQEQADYSSTTPAPLAAGFGQPATERELRLSGLVVEAPFAVLADRYIGSTRLSLNKVNPANGEIIHGTGALLGLFRLESELIALKPFDAPDCVWGLERYVAQRRADLQLDPRKLDGNFLPAITKYLASVQR